MQKDKFTPIHNEILEALSRVNLSSYETRVLFVIWRKIYGYVNENGNRKKYDYIALSQFTELTGLNKSLICRALNGLKKKNIIIKERMKIGFTKNFMKEKVIDSDNKVIDLDNEVIDSDNKKLSIQTTNKVIDSDNKVIDLDNEVIDSDNKKLSIQRHTKEKKETYTKESIYIPYQEIKTLFLNHCVSFPKIRELTKHRKNQIRLRWLKYKDLSVFKELFKKAEASNFLSGRNKKWTACNFDWLINENNMIKTLEGVYDDKGGGSNVNTGGNTKRFENERQYSDEEHRKIAEKFYS